MKRTHIPYIVAEMSMVPQTSVKLEGKNAETMLKLMEALEDSDDVQKVYANFDISEEEMERLSRNFYRILLYQESLIRFTSPLCPVN